MDLKYVQLCHFVLAFLRMTHLASGNHTDSVVDLYKRLFLNNNAKLRPIRNQTEPLLMDIFVHMTAIVDVSEVDQRVEFNAWVNLSWIDEIRFWDPESFDGMRMFFPEPGDAWTPRLLVSNSIDKTDVFEDAQTYHFIFANGSTRFYPSGTFRISCQMKMSYFPFDTQTCHLRVLTKYLSSFVKFRVIEKDDKDAAISGFGGHGEWDLSTVTQSAGDQEFEGETYSVFIMTFELTRKPTFVVLVVVLPVIMLSLISLLVFLLPAESGEKVSFGITVLLSLSVFTSFISDLLPRNSQSLPILVIYLFGLMMLSGIAVVTTILTLASSTSSNYENMNSSGSNNRHKHRTNNNSDLAMDSEEIATVVRLLRGTGVHNHAFDDGGSDKGNLSTSSRGHLRSSGFKRLNHNANNGTHSSSLGSSSAANHSNQWRTNDQTYLPSGFSNDVIEGHTNTGNGLIQGASSLDTRQNDYGDTNTHGQHGSSGFSFGTIFDRLNASRRSSTYRRDSNHDGHPTGTRCCRTTFLNRISREDKILFCSFFLVWSVLTLGFVLFSTLK